MLGDVYRELPHPLALCHCKEFARQFCRRYIAEKQIGLLLGSGVSRSATGLGWEGLMNGCLQALVARGNLAAGDPRATLNGFPDALKAASFINSSSADLLALVRSVLYAKSSRYSRAVSKSSPALDLALRLQSYGCKPTICTLNYDSFVEDYIRKRGQRFTSVLSAGETDPHGVEVWHPHGKVSRTPVAGEWITFTETDYSNRRTGASSVDKFWSGKLTALFDEKKMLVIGAGGDDDAWHREVELLNGLGHLKLKESYRGVWLLVNPGRGFKIPSRVLDRIARMHFVPVIFGSVGQINEFINELVFEH